MGIARPCDAICGELDAWPDAYDEKTDKSSRERVHTKSTVRMPSKLAESDRLSNVGLVTNTKGRRLALPALRFWRGSLALGGGTHRKARR